MKRTAKIKVFEGTLGKGWYWRLTAPNGRIIADSAEAYSSRRKAADAVLRLLTTVRAVKPNDISGLVES
jgi:uncharacterized protein YegP (UPF0339 family)